MPVYRTSDGKIVEERTRQEKSKEQPKTDESAPTLRPEMEKPAAPGGTRGSGGGFGSAYDEPTRKIGEKPKQDEPHTRLVGSRRSREDKERLEQSSETHDAMSDPVVGWLVIVAGPGKGRSMRLGYGTNSLGRAKEHRVPLDFGDDQISRETHATVTYDPRGRKYYVQHGGGKNLTYLDDNPVLQPVRLKALDQIVVGNTTLRFVPLCGPEFDWQDTESESAG